jgi:hypothetical protein
LDACRDRRRGEKGNGIMRSAYLLVGALCLAACSSSSDNGTTDAGPTGTPTIKITSPKTGASVAIADLTGGTTVAVQYSVTSFDLKTAGTCGAEKSCGHIHVLVNADACNATGLPANDEDVTNPIPANLSFCKPGVAPGNYTIALELHDDSHAPVKDATGATIADQVTIAVTGVAGDAGTDTGAGG